MKASRLSAPVTIATVTSGSRACCRVFAHFADAGLLKPGTLPRDGIAADSGVNAELCKQRLMEFVRSTLYERFCMHPALADFVDQFLGGLTYLHKRKIMRYTRPSD